MPICESDPWRLQYFDGVPCPDDLRIPTEDGQSWAWFPRYQWVYNKLEIAQSQGLACAPHGIDPPDYPVFSKPIYNMRGMGAGSHVLHSEQEYHRLERPGHFWVTLLEGEHVSTDIAVVDGEPRWWRHSTGLELGKGVFDYWTVHAGSKPDVEAYCGDWVRRHLKGYTGMANCETIGGKIIEVQLRFSDQFPDLYGGRPWVEAVVRLYADGRWDYDDGDRRDGYSVVLFGAHGVQYRHPPQSVLDEVRAMPGVSSVQITFHEDWPPSRHSMPPGGFRLAVINGWDLDSGRRAREKLALSFWSAQQLLPRGGRRHAAKAPHARG